MAKKKTEKIELGFKPHVHQRHFLDHWKRFNVLACCRRWGKSVIGSMVLGDDSINLAASKRKKAPRFAYITPEKDQAKQIVWPIFKEFFAPLIKKQYLTIKETALEIHFWGGGQIKLYGADNGNAEPIRGNYLDGVVLDEADQINMDVVWDEIVAPALEDTMGWALFCGSIRGRSNLYNMFQQNAADPEWNCQRYPFSQVWQDLPAYSDYDEETGLYTPSAYKHQSVLNRYKDKPHTFAREYEVDWDADLQDALIPTEYRDKATGRHLDKEAYEKAPRIIGVDPAGIGADCHAIAKRQGRYLHPLRRIPQCSEQELAQIVAAEAMAMEADMVFVDNTGGYGTETISRLRDLGITWVQAINFGSSATNKEQFLDRRTEMAYAVRAWLMDEAPAIPNDPMFLQEMSVLTVEETSTGKAKLLKKDKIREAIGRSPDSWDAVMLTHAAPVVRRDRSNGGIEIKTTCNNQYRPWENRRR